MEPPKALVFDVFGTLVDWRTSIALQLRAFGRSRGLEADWERFVDAWRAAYVPSMERVRRGEIGWANLDALHAASFDDLWRSFGLQSLPPDERTFCVEMWHRLEPWSDVRAGLERLRRRYVVGTLSNGNVALQVDLVRHAGLHFDVLFSAEHFRRYKPDAGTYLGAAELLGLAPAELMRVAAHNGDLAAAASCGLRTAFIARPHEYGPEQRQDLAPEPRIELAARDLVALAEALPGA
jgi:2-haloacid dehalogenase